MITTGFEILNLIYAANISLKHVIDIDNRYSYEY